MCTSDEKMQGTHINGYDLMSRPDGDIKDYLVGVVKTNAAENFVVIVKTDVETMTSDIEIMKQGFSDQYSQFCISPPNNTTADIHQLPVLTVPKTEAQAFFGDQPIIVSAKLNRPLIRRIYTNL